MADLILEKYSKFKYMQSLIDGKIILKSEIYIYIEREREKERERNDSYLFLYIVSLSMTK